MAENLEDEFARMARELTGGMPNFTDLDLLKNEHNLRMGQADEITAKARLMRDTTTPEEQSLPASERLEAERQRQLKEDTANRIRYGIKPEGPQ